MFSQLSNKLKIFLFLSVVSCFAMIGTWRIVNSALYLRSIRYGTTRLRPQVTNSTNRTFLILYWGYPWGLKSYVPPEGRPSESRCEITHNRNRIQEADLVMFHFTVINDKDMPWRFFRSPEQLFVWWSAENPAVLHNLKEQIRAFDNFFNWTMTYRRDSDVQGFYGYRGNAIAAASRGKKAIDNVIMKKNKLAIWCVSQCDYTNGARLRMKYSQELKKAGLDFDGCGKCFPNGKQLPKGMLPEMRKLIESYKFYLSFENSLHCKDYITEKFWEHSLGSDAVPIVWGPAKEEILAAAPLDSFIFVEDYETPEKLVEYIKYLDSNDTAYREYFRWREDENMTDELMMKMVKARYPDLDLFERPRSICQTLVDNQERKVIKSLSKYFMEGNPKECIG